MAARWLFKQSKPGIDARKAIFQALKVTDVINGASLRDTQVWPEVRQPFCLVFADNQEPEPWHEFLFLSPYIDKSANRTQVLRTDASGAKLIPLNLVLEHDSALKPMYKGSLLDVYLVEKIAKRAAANTIGMYWRKQGLHKSQGFKIGNRARNDSHFKGMPKLLAEYNEHPYLILPEKLNRYRPQKLESPRSREIYTSPLVVARKTVRESRNRGRALLSKKDVLYPEAFYGYSTSGHPQEELLADYLLLLFHSQLFEYHALMTGSQFGVERDVLQMSDIDRMPFIPPEELTSEQHKSIRTLAKTMKRVPLDLDGIDAAVRVMSDDLSYWTDLDNTVAKIYGLTEFDMQRITDIVAIEAPFASSRERGISHVNQDEKKTFIKELEKELRSIFDHGKHRAHVKPLQAKNDLPWHFLTVTLGEAEPPIGLPDNWIDHIDGLGVSQINVFDSEGPSLTIGILNRYRYWIPSRARLLASQIIGEFGGEMERETG